MYLSISKLNRYTPTQIIWYAKLYLLALYLLIQSVALIDGYGIPYYPIELSSLLVMYHIRKALFLAGIGPISVLLWILREDSWTLKGIGVSLFLMILFDSGNEWPLHLLGVLIFGYCVAYNTKQNRQSKLFTLIVFLYTAKTLLCTLYLFLCESSVKSKELYAFGCSGYIQCANPILTSLILKSAAYTQWFIFFLLSLVVTE